jgi:uncharacterized membrane protein HdeD (DUF308 family)
LSLRNVLAPPAPILRALRRHPMIRNRRWRRPVAAALVVLGAVLMLLSPSVNAGLMVFALGVVLELAGLAIERMKRH